MGVGRVYCASGELNPPIWIARNLERRAPRGPAGERFFHAGRHLSYLATAHDRTYCTTRSGNEQCPLAAIEADRIPVTFNHRSTPSRLHGFDNNILPCLLQVIFTRSAASALTAAYPPTAPVLAGWGDRRSGL